MFRNPVYSTACNGSLNGLYVQNCEVRLPKTATENVCANEIAVIALGSCVRYISDCLC